MNASDLNRNDHNAHKLSDVEDKRANMNAGDLNRNDPNAHKLSDVED